MILRYVSNFILLHVIAQFPHPFPIVYSLLAYHRLSDNIYTGLFLGSQFCSIDLYICLFFITVTYCFNYYSFVIQFEIRNCGVPSFVLLAQYRFVYPVAFVVACAF